MFKQNITAIDSETAYLFLRRKLSFVCNLKADDITEFRWKDVEMRSRISFLSNIDNASVALEKRIVRNLQTSTINVPACISTLIDLQIYPITSDLAVLVKH